MKKLAWLLLALPLGLSCAAQVVVDGSGTPRRTGNGGAGGASALSSGRGGNGGNGGQGGDEADAGGPPSCDALLAELAADIVSASICGTGPNEPFQCGRVPGVVDACDCPLAVNMESLSAIDAISQAEAAAKAAHCKAICDAPCGSEWASPACIPNDQSTGHCVLIAGD